MSEDVQDERYVTVPWTAMSEDVQDERYVTVPWSAGAHDKWTALIAIPAPLSKESATGWPGTSEFERQTANSRLRLAHFPFLRVC